MFKYNDKKVLLALLAVALVVCMPIPASAAIGAAKFGSLTNAGKDIFEGLRDIIYPASALGIIMICITGFFGSINWKWLTAIIVGLVVISASAAFVCMFAPEAANEIPKGSLESGL